MLSEQSVLFLEQVLNNQVDALDAATMMRLHRMIEETQDEAELARIEQAAELLADAMLEQMNALLADEEPLSLDELSE